MPHDRFYVDSPLDGRVLIEGEESHHMTRVMRKKEGSSIEMVNGKGLLALGTIVSVSKREVYVDIEHVEKRAPALSPLILIQALPKPSLLELIIQKGTELGVSKFYLYSSQYSEKKELSPNQLKRLHHILIASMKQCGRLDLPQLEMGFPDLDIPLFFGDLRSNAPPLIKQGELPSALAIGPEKGFSEEEMNQLDKKGKGVRLAPYTLRTETAAITGLSILANA